MKIILISGSTATGKSTLARQLAKDLDMPVFSRDEYKERTYDALSKKPTLRRLYVLEQESWDALYDAIKMAVANNKSLIVEANFEPKHQAQLAKLIKPDTPMYEVFCYTDGWTMFARFRHRKVSGERHPVHLDRWWYPLVIGEAIKISMNRRKVQPLRLTPRVLEVDTTNFEAVDYEAIRRFVVAQN